MKKFFRKIIIITGAVIVGLLTGSFIWSYFTQNEDAVEINHIDISKISSEDIYKQSYSVFKSFFENQIVIE